MEGVHVVVLRQCFLLLSGICLCVSFLHLQKVWLFDVKMGFLNTVLLDESLWLEGDLFRSDARRSI